MTAPKPAHLKRKPGPKPKNGLAQGAQGAVSPTVNEAPRAGETQAPAGASAPASSSSSGSQGSLKDLGAAALQNRAGDGKGKTRTIITKADKKKAAKSRPSDEPIDEEACEYFGQAVADTEVQLACWFVEAEDAPDIEKASKMLAYAWKFAFMQYGWDWFKAWVLLLFAHVALVARVTKKGRSKIEKWWDEFKRKLDGKKPVPKDPQHQPVQQPTPQQASRVAVTEKSKESAPSLSATDLKVLGTKPPDEGAPVAEGATVLPANTPPEILV